MIEAYSIVLRLGRAEGIAVFGMTLGRFLAANDETHADALEVLRRSVETFRKLGRENELRQVEERIAELGLE